MSAPGTVSIRELAAHLDVTARTLRYWEELGLLSPCPKKGSAERSYTAEEVQRAEHIRQLQELLGLRLIEIRVVLETEDTLDRLCDARRRGDIPRGDRRLLDDALRSASSLLAQIDTRLENITAYREELARRLQNVRRYATQQSTSPTGTRAGS